MLVERGAYDAFMDALAQVFTSFWPKGALHSDAEGGKIINSKHFERLKALVKSTKGNVVLGGQIEEDGMRIAPMVVADVTSDDPLMTEYV